MSSNPLLNKLCKWRAIYTDWRVGTQARDTPGNQAERDIHERLIIMRAELNALTYLMQTKGAFTQQEFSQAVENAASQLDADLAAFFKGFKSGHTGIEIVDMHAALMTRERLGFPP